MVLITLWEIVQILIMVGVIGYIFTGFVKVKPKTVYDYLHPKRFDWTEFKYAVYVSAPAIVLHEMAHKFVAMGFGYTATFEIFVLGLAIALFLKLVHSPFLIIAPAYVKLSGITNDLAYRLIAFAGPFVNLVLWLGALIVLKNYSKNLSRKWVAILSMTKTLNMILFFFNMIPFGPFDGAKVIFGLP